MKEFFKTNTKAIVSFVLGATLLGGAGVVGATTYNKQQEEEKQVKQDVNIEAKKVVEPKTEEPKEEVKAVATETTTTSDPVAPVTEPTPPTVETIPTEVPTYEPILGSIERPKQAGTDAIERNVDCWYDTINIESNDNGTATYTSTLTGNRGALMNCNIAKGQTVTVIVRGNGGASFQGLNLDYFMGLK